MKIHIGLRIKQKLDHLKKLLIYSNTNTNNSTNNTTDNADAKKIEEQ